MVDSEKFPTHFLDGEKVAPFLGDENEEVRRKSFNFMKRLQPTMLEMFAESKLVPFLEHCFYSGIKNRGIC